jgi:uncharacterized protein
MELRRGFAEKLSRPNQRYSRQTRQVLNIAGSFGCAWGALALTSRRFQLYSTESGTPVLPLMKIPIDEIPESPKEIQFLASIDELNEAYAKGPAREFRFPPVVEVDVVCYRSGRELFFRGSLQGSLESTCSRCLKDFRLPVRHEFNIVLSPKPAPSNAATEELRPEDLGLSYYSGEEIDLAPLVREQVLLALPTRPLCAENCRGLCSGCGADLNSEECRCSRDAEDPRMAIFRTLRIDR